MEIVEASEEEAEVVREEVVTPTKAFRIKTLWAREETSSNSHSLEASRGVGVVVLVDVEEVAADFKKTQAISHVTKLTYPKVVHTEKTADSAMKHQDKLAKISDKSSTNNQHKGSRSGLLECRNFNKTKEETKEETKVETWVSREEHRDLAGLATTAKTLQEDNANSTTAAVAWPSLSREATNTNRPQSIWLQRCLATIG